MSDVIEFFIAMEPPKTTAQMHKVTCKSGKPVFYDPPNVLEMKAKLRAGLTPYRPQTPLEGPIRLTVKWIWQHKQLKTDNAYRWKPTKPDTDNLMKAFKDISVSVGYCLDDAQICSEICEKFWGDTPGIYVKFQVLT